MRKELLEAIEKIDSLIQLGKQMIAENTNANSDISPQDEKILQDKSAPYHEKFRVQMQLFSDCLKQRIESIYINQSWSNSMDVKLNDKSADYIVVTMTPYGPLVAIQRYGSVLKEIMEAVQKCILNLGLVQLTDDEIDELYNTHQYYNLF